MIRHLALLSSVITTLSCTRDRPVAHPEVERPVGLPETMCGPIWSPEFDEPDGSAEYDPEARAEHWVLVFTTGFPHGDEKRRRAFAFPEGDAYEAEAVVVEGPGCEDFSVSVYVWRKGAPCYAFAGFAPTLAEVRVWAAAGGSTVLMELDEDVYDESLPEGRTRKTVARELSVTPTSAPSPNANPGR